MESLSKSLKSSIETLMGVVTMEQEVEYRIGGVITAYVEVFVPSEI